MKISLIIPTFSPQSYLWECLDSVYAQTFSKAEFEVIIVLNGCKEPYDSQIKAWLQAHDDLNVQYIQTDVGGVSNARNVALDIAKGNYVAFVDDDDIISPCYLQDLYDLASPDTVSLCYPYAFDDGKLDEQLPYRITNAYDYCVRNGCKHLSSKVRKFFSGPCMKLIAMSIIQHRRFDVRFKNGEDSLFMFLISDKIKNVAFTSKNAIYYRRVRINSTATIYRPFINVFVNSLKLIIVYMKVYLSNWRNYNFYFFTTRILGSIKAITNYKKSTY